MGGGGNHTISSGILGATLVDSSSSDCTSSNTHQPKSQNNIRIERLNEMPDLDKEDLTNDETRWEDGFCENEPSSKEDGVDETKRHSNYLELIDNYERNSESGSIFVSTNLQLAKNAIRSYMPGEWTEQFGDMTLYDYDIPRAATLLLVGPRGSGKSSLVNRISRTFEDQLGYLLPDRAQESYNLSATDGTCFLQEYMIPRHSKSFCLYDTCSLSENSSDNFKLLKMWMTQGVRHGEKVLSYGLLIQFENSRQTFNLSCEMIMCCSSAPFYHLFGLETIISFDFCFLIVTKRNSDSLATKEKIKAEVRHGGFFPSEHRKVNFVIFVVNGISVLKTMHNKNKNYTDNLVETFNYPFMSFRDSRPVLVVTHGDLLSFSERAQVCTHLGEILGIPPTKQIFDIPDATNPATELAIMDMLRYSLEQADRNLPFKQSFIQMIEDMLQWLMYEVQDSIPWISIPDLVHVGLIMMLLSLFVIFMNW